MMYTNNSTNDTMHESYVNSLQADIDKLKATLSEATDPEKRSWCEDYIKALEEEKQECKYETCALCGGICDRCYYTEACERYNGTAQTNLSKYLSSSIQKELTVYLMTKL